MTHDTHDITRGPRRPGRRKWFGVGARLALALSAAACAKEDVSEEPIASIAVDLHAAQLADDIDLADGDEGGFARADHSRSLLVGRKASGSNFGQRRGACYDDPRVRLGLVSVDTCIGAELFLRESFGGNGRTCSSCHPVVHNFTLDPQYISSLSDDDPLFIAELDPGLSQLEQPDLLREFALVLTNPDGFEDPTHKFAMRSTSHIWSMATSIESPPQLPGTDQRLDGSPLQPVHHLGWSGDSGEMIDFATRAITQHATRSLDRQVYRDFIEPNATQKAMLERYQLSVGRMNELDITQMTLSDEGAERGRKNYIDGPAHDCNNCHNNGGATVKVFDDENMVTFDSNFNFDTGTESNRLAVLDKLGIPRDGGQGTKPRDLDGDGVPDVFGTGAFNTTPLIEAADTPPFFHGNSAATLEDAIRHYTTHFFSDTPAGRRPTPSRPHGEAFQLDEPQIAELGRFLRVLNVAFNAELAIARLQASFQINDAFGNRYISIQRGLLELASLELGDAERVLSEVDDLNPETKRGIERAQRAIRRARDSLYREERQQHTRDALVGVAEASTKLGTGLHFEIGEGTLMF